MEQQREDLLRIQGLGLFGRDEAFLDRGFLDALGGEALTVVLDDELIATVPQVLKRQAHHALEGLARGQARGGQLDAVDDGIAHCLYSDVLDRAPEIVGYRVEADALQYRFLA